jgi:hypothetical protein
MGVPYSRRKSRHRRNRRPPESTPRAAGWRYRRGLHRATGLAHFALLADGVDLRKPKNSGPDQRAPVMTCATFDRLRNVWPPGKVVV